MDTDKKIEILAAQIKRINAQDEQIKQLIYANQCKAEEIEELKASKEIRHGFGSSYKVDVDGDLQNIEKIVGAGNGTIYKDDDDEYIIIIPVSSLARRIK